MVTNPSVDEIRQQVSGLLLEQEVGALATIREGRPHVATMHFASDGLVVYCHTFTHTRTYAALKEDPHVSYTLTALPEQGFYERDQTRWVQVEGTASILDDRAEIDHAISLSGQQFPWLKDSDIYDGFKQASYHGNHVFFRVMPREALWSDNRVSFEWHTMLAFDADGERIIESRPFTTMQAPDND